RARLAVLSEFAPDWTAALDRWDERHRAMKADLPSGPAPDSQHEWMLYQGALAIWPLDVKPHESTGQRLQDFLLKAARESKRRTIAWRRERAATPERGGYRPLAARGPRARHVVAFIRDQGSRTLIAAVPRLCTALTAPGAWPLGEAVWSGTTLPLPDGAPAAW